MDFMNDASYDDSVVPQSQSGDKARITSADDTRTAIINDLETLLPSASVSNFQGSPMERWKMAAKGQNESQPGNELDSAAVIALKYWYMHRVQMMKADGEVTNPIRTVLFDANGQIWHFVSDGIARALAQLLQFVGNGELNPPVNIKVVKIKTANKRETMSLIPAE
jgi:hypothetical protein